MDDSLEFQSCPQKLGVQRWLAEGVVERLCHTEVRALGLPPDRLLAKGLLSLPWLRTLDPGGCAHEVPTYPGALLDDSRSPLSLPC